MAKIIEGDNVCTISMEKIEENDYYMTCDVCHKNYKSDILKEWLQRNNSCPTCRNQWITYDKPRIKEYRNCKPKERGFLGGMYVMGKLMELFGPKDMELEGFAEKIKEEVEMGSFDDVMKAIYEKYNKRTNPYIGLSLIYSAISQRFS
jgi:hypothetical protein